jgi:hypothetical protein
MKVHAADLALARLALTSAVGTPSGPVAEAVLALGFDPAEASMVQAVTDYGNLRPLEELWDSVLEAREGKSRGEDVGAFALLLGIEPAEVSCRLLVGAPLTDSGLLRRVSRHGDLATPVAIEGHVGGDVDPATGQCDRDERHAEPAHGHPQLLRPTVARG